MLSGGRHNLNGRMTQYCQYKSLSTYITLFNYKENDASFDCQYGIGQRSAMKEVYILAYIYCKRYL